MVGVKLNEKTSKSEHQKYTRITNQKHFAPTKALFLRLRENEYQTSLRSTDDIAANRSYLGIGEYFGCEEPAELTRNRAEKRVPNILRNFGFLDTTHQKDSLFTLSRKRVPNISTYYVLLRSDRILPRYGWICFVRTAALVNYSSR